MKPWIALYDYYLASVPGCTYATAANALRSAAQEFCERTRAWRVTLAPVVTEANRTIYDLPLAAGQELAQLRSAKLDGHAIAVLLAENEDDGSAGVLMLSQRELLLTPACAAGLQLVLRTALKPSNDATGLDDLLYAHHAEAIAEGAKFRLYSMEGQPFTDQNAALLARARFESAIGATTIKIAKAHGTAPLRVKPSFM